MHRNTKCFVFWLCAARVDAKWTGGLHPPMLGAVLALTFSYNIALGAIVLIVPLYLHSQGVTPVVLGLAASLPPLVGLVLRLPGGMLSDRVGERAVLIGATVAMGLAAGALMLAPGSGETGTAMIIAALLLSGVSRAVYWPCAQSYASRAAHGNFARVSGLFTSAGHFGQILATPLCGWLLATVGFGAGFGLIVAGAGIGFVISLRLQKPPRPAAAGATGARRAANPGAPGASLLDLARSPMMLFAGLCLAGAAVATALAGSFYPVYLADLGMRADTIGWLSSCRALAAMLSSFAMGIMGARLAIPWAWLLGAGMAGLGIALTPVLASFAGLAVAMALIGASGGILQVLGMDVAARGSQPRDRAKAMAFTGMFFSISLWAIPVVTGIVAQVAGLRVSFTLLGAFWLGLAVLVLGPARKLFAVHPVTDPS